MQKTQTSLSLYVLGVVVCFLAIAPVASAFGILINQSWIFACQGKGYAPDNMMAYCKDPRFADYEHAAYLRGLEPGALGALKAADVVTLGNSRIQLGFSQQETIDYFSGKGLKVHLLGLGDGETADFPRMLMERHDIRPRAVIINLDYFFVPGFSPAAQESMRTGWRTDLAFFFKRELQAIHPQICAAAPWVCGHSRGIYRDRTTGMWSSENYDRDTPVSWPGPERAERPGDMAALKVRAEAYIGWLESRGTCVILTGVPSAEYDRDIAEALARELGRPAVFPKVDGLETYDASHLTIRSAKEYMQVMYGALEPALQACGLLK